MKALPPYLYLLNYGLLFVSSFVMFFQLSTGKYGDKFWLALIWFFISTFPVVFSALKTRQLLAAPVTTMYLVFLLMVFVIIPIAYNIYALNALKVLFYSLLIIIPFGAYLLYRAKSGSALFFKKSYKITVTGEQKAKWMKDISRNKLEGVLNEIYVLAEADFFLSSRIVMISREYEEAKESLNQNLIKPEDYGISLSKITKSLVNLIADL